MNKLLVAFLTRHKRSPSFSSATENRQNNEAKKVPSSCTKNMRITKDVKKCIGFGREQSARV